MDGNLYTYFIQSEARQRSVLLLLMDKTTGNNIISGYYYWGKNITSGYNHWGRDGVLNFILT